MKLRLEKGSVKVRLSTEEISRLSTDKFLEERLNISEGIAFGFSVQILSDQKSIAVRFQNNNLEIIVPEASAQKWMNSKQIGIKETFHTNLGESIDLVVEEDLPPRKTKNPGLN